MLKLKSIFIIFHTAIISLIGFPAIAGIIGPVDLDDGIPFAPEREDNDTNSEEKSFAFFGTANNEGNEDVKLRVTFDYTDTEGNIQIFDGSPMITIKPGNNQRFATWGFIKPCPPKVSIELEAVGGDLKNVQGDFTHLCFTPPDERMYKDIELPQLDNLEDNLLATLTFTAPNELSFNNFNVTTALLNNQVPSINDPILGGTILIDNANLVGVNYNDKWFFSDTTYQILVDGIPVLSANLVDNWLFQGGGNMPNFDSEFQGTLENLQINNIINSPYLTHLELESNSQQFLSIFSNILTETNNLTITGSSGSAFMQGSKTTPEPNLLLGLVIFGGAGLLSSRKKIK